MTNDSWIKQNMRFQEKTKADNIISELAKTQKRKNPELDFQQYSAKIFLIYNIQSKKKNNMQLL